MKMNNTNLTSIIHLRTLIGFLGEQSQYNWWPSSFYSQDSSVFLEPIFPKTTDIARYHGVVEAGKLLHDERIGVGRVFHLFRLPKVLEQSLFDYLRENGISESTKTAIETQERATAELKRLATGGIAMREGPTQMGNSNELNNDEWFGMAAAHYLAAFEAGAMSFPYLAEAT